MVTIRRLQKADEIELCEKLPIANRLWGTDNEMICYGQMGYLPEREWIVKLTACEEEPRATYTQNDEPVYKDSALEVFLNFAPMADWYMNLEVNANGALLCHFGRKGEREPVVKRSTYRASVFVQRAEHEWSVLLRIPVGLINDCFGDVKLEPGAEVRFNMYKISETEEILHFISYTDIPVEKPDFHLPQYFAQGIMG